MPAYTIARFEQKNKSPPGDTIIPHSSFLILNKIALEIKPQMLYNNKVYLNLRSEDIHNEKIHT